MTNLQGDNIRDKFFWITWFFLLAVYFLIKYGALVFIEHLFIQQNFSLLNQLSFTSGQLSLSEYQGYANEQLIGPVYQTIGGILFALIGLKLFKEVSFLKFTLIIFAYFLITKFEVLFFPAYGEVCAVPLVEGIWLFHNNFDYVGLAQQKAFGQGGPKSYLFSLYPTYIALLLKFTPSFKAFATIYHLLNFFYASVIAALIHSISLKVFNRANALLVAVVLISIPLFQANTELINMEISVTLFAVLSAFFTVNQKFGRGCLFAVLASLTKGSGGMACAAFLIVMCLVFLFDPKRRFQWRYPLLGLTAFILGFSKVFLRRFIYMEAPNHSKFEPLVGWIPLTSCYYLMWALVFVALAWVVFSATHLFQRKQTQENFFVKFYPFIVMSIFALMWYALYLNVSVMGPRYKVLLTPFIIGSLAFALTAFIRSERVLKLVLLLAVVVACFGSYGFYFPHKYESTTYSYNELERSLEYRNDLKMILQLRDTLKRDFPGFTVGAPFVLAQKLALPELGYVDEPMDVVMYGMSATYGGIRNFEGLDKLDIRRTIWIGLKSTLPEQIVFPIAPVDRVMTDVRAGNKKATLFMGGFAIEQVRQIIMRQSGRQ